MNKTRIGIVLSGCGFIDGAEVHESVLTMLAVDRRGGDMIIMSPYANQMHVVDHTTGKESGKDRRIEIESARIARGKVKNMSEVTADQLDALIFPGGYGAAKNLCNFALKGVGMTVLPEVEKLIKEVHSAGKPVGFICIAPVLAAKVIGGGVKLTIGNDPSTAEAIKGMGGVHVNCTTDDIVIDREKKVVSTPAYMLGPNIAKVSTGIDKLVEAIFNLL